MRPRFFRLPERTSDAKLVGNIALILSFPSVAMKLQGNNRSRPKGRLVRPSDKIHKNCAKNRTNPPPKERKLAKILDPARPGKGGGEN